MSRGAKNVEVSFYANSELKHKAIVVDGKTVEAYPLYVLVQYGRAHTSFKVEIENDQFLVTKDLSQITSFGLAEKIETYKRTIFDLIYLEEKTYKDSFTLKGFGSRVRQYHLTVVAFLQKVEASKLFDFFQSRENQFINEGHKFLQYNKLMNEFQYIKTDCKAVTALDWLFKDGKDKVRKTLYKDELQQDILSLSNGETVPIGVDKEFHIASWMLFIDSLLLIKVM